MGKLEMTEIKKLDEAAMIIMHNRDLYPPAGAICAPGGNDSDPARLYASVLFIIWKRFYTPTPLPF